MSFSPDNHFQMKDQALRLIEYDHWANREIIRATSKAGDEVAEPLRLLSHVLAVSSIWLSRVTRQSATAQRFDLYTLDECVSINDTMLSAWTETIHTVEDFHEKRIPFNFSGKQSLLSVLDCINHVAIHGSYHRGQIVALLKGKLPELPMTDFVLFGNTK